jgi:broad specificity phosphatase PhoE
VTNFYLVRHAEKSDAVDSGDPALSPHGIRQARWTARHLARSSIDAIYSSPLVRAHGTARYIAQELRLPVYICPALRERANWGDDPLQTREEFVAMWEYATHHRDWQPPIGDSSRRAGERLEGFLRALADAYPAAHLVLVTHGGIIGDLVRNLFSDDEVRRHTLDISTVAHCSITAIRHAAGQFYLAAYANDHHLRDLTSTCKVPTKSGKGSSGPEVLR